MRPTETNRPIAATLLVLTVLVGSLWLAGPAGAQTYGGACTVAATYTDATDQLQVSGSGFAPSTAVTVLVDGSSVGSTTTSATGTLAATFTVALAAGSHTVSADCDGAGTGTVLGQTTINVGAAGAPLPRTGDDSAPLVGIALAIAALGAVLVLVARHRRHSAA